MSFLVRNAAIVNRVVLAAACILFTLIGLRNIFDPMGEAAAHGITLGAPEAITIMRVTGGIFLALAMAFLACLVSPAHLGKRLLLGTELLALVATVLTAVRLLGMVLDGAAPFTLKVLKPEVAMVIISTAAFLLERRRQAAARASSSERSSLGDVPAFEKGRLA
jgi:hypothetical protein